MKTATFRVLWFALLCLGSAACRPQLFRHPEWSDEAARVYVLSPAGPSAEIPAATERITRIFPAARPVNLLEAQTAMTRGIEEQAILIIPEPRAFPRNLWGTLQNYLNAGGAAIFVGTDPFADRAIIDASGRCAPERERLARAAAQAEFIESVSSVAAWEHRNERNEIGGRVRVASAPVSGWNAVQVDVDRLIDWNALILPLVPAGVLSEKHRSVTFYARGSEKTSRLFMECTEHDGATWRLSVPLSRVWSLYVRHEGEFHYVSGPPSRGGASDSLSFANVKKIAIGVSAATDLQPPGPHRFDLSDVRWLADERSSADVREQPDILLLSPAFRRYSTRAARFLSLEDHRVLTYPQPLTVESPLPRARGVGGNAGLDYRWIPLLEAQDDHGRPQGWPVSVLVAVQSNRVLRKWAWVALPDDAPEDLFRTMLRTAGQKLRSAHYLHHAGLPRFALTTGEPILVQASAASGRDSPLPSLDVVAELYRDGTPVPGRRVRLPLSASGVAKLSLGPVPTVSEAEIFRVRIDLLAPAQGVLYDTVWQSLCAHPPARPTDSTDWIATRGSEFVYRGRRQFWLGVHYRPAFAAGLDNTPESCQRRWLEPGVFDPQLMEHDIDRLREIGVNAIGIELYSTNEAPSLRYVVEAAKRRGLWIYLRMPPWDLLAEDTPAFCEQLVKAAQLVEEPTVFALDLGIRLNTDSEAAQARLAQAWRTWLLEQYGTREHAEAILGNVWDYAGWKDAGQSDTRTGEAVQRTWRRFLDDLISRQIGHGVRRLRSWGIRQLLTTRADISLASAGESHRAESFDPSWGRIHLDFYSMVMPLNRDKDNLISAGIFWTAWARGVSDGKPVIGEGSLMMAPDGGWQLADLDLQAERFRWLFDLALTERWGGAFGSDVLAKAPSTDEKGALLFEVDGTLRPAGEVYREMSNRLRRERAVGGTPPRTRSVEMLDYERGLGAIWSVWRDTDRVDGFASNVTDLILADLGTRSRAWIPRTLGDAILQAPAPFQSLNAEWGRVEVNGREVERKPGEVVTLPRGMRLHAELINTGPVSWDASREGQPQTVWVRLSRTGHASILLTLPPMPFRRRHTVVWLATDPGEWVARAWLAGVGEFGEALRIRVVE